MSDERPNSDSLSPRPPSPMEFGSMPLDPVYGWGLVFEPVETLIERTAAYIEQLAQEAGNPDVSSAYLAANHTFQGKHAELGQIIIHWLNDRFE